MQSSIKQFYPVQINPNDQRILARPFGYRRPFRRPFWGSPFLGGVLGGLLGSVLLGTYGYGYPYYPYYGYPYYPYFPFY